MRRPNLVYFIKPVGLDGPIKIGCSNVPANRLETLAAWSPWPLEVIGSVLGQIKDEQFLHRCFADTHSHREWFHSSPQLRDAIARILAAGSIDGLRPTLIEKGEIRNRKRRQWSEDRRQCFSLASKIRWAEKRLRRAGEDTAWSAPDDVHRIISGWDDSWWRGGKGRPARPEELARIHEYLANPSAYSVVPNWRRKPADPAEPERCAS